MKYLTVLIILLSLFLSIKNLHAQWVQTNGPAFAKVQSLTSNGTNIFAGTNGGGVYLSTDNGTNWTQSGLLNDYVQCLTVVDNNLFAGTFYGVFLSTDNGINWIQVGLTSYSVMSFAVKDNNIFAGTSDGDVFLSTDLGTNWKEAGPYNPTYAVYALATNGSNIFAGTYGDGVYLSTNDGTEWSSVNNGLTGHWVHSLAISGTNIFAGTEVLGVFLSTNNGTDWTNVSNGMNFTVVVSAFAVSGTNIFASDYDVFIHNGGVFHSTNNGTTWTLVNDGLPNYVESLMINGNNIYAGTSSAGVWKRPLSELTGVTKEINSLPKDFTLYQNYPNPFNPNTVISYSLPSSSNVKLIVYNTLGQSIKILESSYKPAGNYSVNFNASNLPSGIYFYKLEAGQFSQIKKMILIK